MAEKESKDFLKKVTNSINDLDLQRLDVSSGDIVYVRYVKDVSENFRGNAALYETSVPVVYIGIEDTADSTNYVIISGVTPYDSILEKSIDDADDLDEKYPLILNAIKAMPDEVLIFPAHPDGNAISFLDIGGVKGTRDHEEAIISMGWILVGDFLR